VTIGAARLVLASASPRRQALLGLLGFAWRVAPSTIDEERYLLDDPLVSALNVALAKARAIKADAHEVVVAADTIVALDGTALGKPGDAAAADHMLRTLRGRGHDVLTGVAIRRGGPDGQEWGGVVSTRVVMRDYGDEEIAAYVSRGEPFDKAGGYAVQDSLFSPVARCDGCYLNVVGLPLCAVVSGLQALGVAMGGDEPRREPPCGYCKRGAPLVAIR
jgi:septum formation protein